ncbi:Secreted RxLR effector peptide protein [Phytophthora palmivora]|uniref:Secreted RxLR effector peptide protein n=1 Tax=Phytophthora palmivora TaxID=4796 RepID=A0A2P4X2V5_9STRA|nr:Secreted RxLR effector peptide protein [Phytophthora palmivora]
MRFSFLVVLIVATFIASCISFTNAENVAQINAIEGDNNLKGTRRLATTDEWWLSDNTEERGGTSFLGKLKLKASRIRGSGAVKTEKLNDAQIKTISKEVATTVKKDRRTWPIIKKYLVFIYGALLAGLIYVSVDAMLYQM